VRKIFLFLVITWGAIGVSIASELCILANIDLVCAIVTTDVAEDQIDFGGQIGFLSTYDQDSQRVLLARLGLVSRGEPQGDLDPEILDQTGTLAEIRISHGVQTSKGMTGLLSILLEPHSFDLTYGSKSGLFAVAVTCTLHFELIDEIRGFTPYAAGEDGAQGDGSPEDTDVVFLSHKESMAGWMVGKLDPWLPDAGEEAKLDAYLYLETTSSGETAGLVKKIALRLRVVLRAVRGWLGVHEVLRVQPVFIGRPAASSGWSFVHMMAAARDVWDRCGTSRCIQFQVLPPIYLNAPAFFVLSGVPAANALRRRINVANAVEVFVVLSWRPFWDGGGACWAAGTAAAQIVTCDEQLCVPCPPPNPPCPGRNQLCGSVNVRHLAHELGHALGLAHPGPPGLGLAASRAGSIMDPSGFCRDNPNSQSAMNCQNAFSPLLRWGWAWGACTRSPDVP